MMEVMDSRPSPTNTSSVSLASVSMTQVLTVAASPAMASATRVMLGEYSVDLAAAFWLTMAATPEGAQGQVTFQLAFLAVPPPLPLPLPPLLLLLPQPARRPRAMARTRDKLSSRFFMIHSPFQSA